MFLGHWWTLLHKAEVSTETGQLQPATASLDIIPLAIVIVIKGTLDSVKISENIGSVAQYEREDVVGEWARS
jgi:hypothetical protein